ncbi:MAG: hypothetical protein ICV83_17690, partial [Cytophagales bacterium]|nr:hypothetical protein [Cytophagales bacterium]
MLKKTNWALYVVLVLSLLAGCKEPETVTPQPPAPTAVNNVAKVNKSLYDIMKEVYLWNDQLPATFDPTQYRTQDEALEALTYKTYDRWSYLEDLQVFMDYFEGGEYVGNGLGLKLDRDGNMLVSYVYPNSPAGKAGLGRGLRISRIN